jgi:hypothetical protein
LFYLVGSGIMLVINPLGCISHLFLYDLLFPSSRQQQLGRTQDLTEQLILSYTTSIVVSTSTSTKVCSLMIINLEMINIWRFTVGKFHTVQQHLPHLLVLPSQVGSFNSLSPSPFYPQPPNPSTPSTPSTSTPSTPSALNSLNSITSIT